ncbi:MAG: hypothetical protein II879_02485 [Clostridia bacterium]|nr:hypothetical protein [Clostridia bacterium]
MKRLILVACLLVCLLALNAIADTQISWQKSEEMILSEIGTAFPGWTVSVVDVYGSGSYKGSIATHVAILLYRIEGNTLQLKDLDILVDPVLEGEPIEWNAADSAPVPVSEEAAERIAALPPDQLMYDSSQWLSRFTMPGCAEFMLSDSETWEELGVLGNDLVGVVRNQDGRKGLRMAHWDGNTYGVVVFSPMWERTWSLNPIHSGNGSLELMVDDGLLYVDLYPDGIWRFSGVNNGYGIYIFEDDYMLDGTNGISESSNDLWHYGRASFPRELDRLDIDRIPMRGTELISLLNASDWACVRQNDTLMYAEPEGEIIAHAYARLPGIVIQNKDDFVCLQIGSKERGIQAWFYRDQLVFGAETENIRCGFPAYNYDWDTDQLASILNRHLTPSTIQYSDDIFDADYPDVVWLIACLPNGGFLAEVNEDAVGSLPADAFDKILPTEDYYPSYDLMLSSAEWAKLWSDDDDEADYEDWYEEKWNSDEFWGSFTSELSYSFDRKYYAVQTWEPSSRNKTGMVTVKICETGTDEQKCCFIAGRTFDFWGICWEKDSYNLWTQSADTGLIGYEYHNGNWECSDELRCPDYIISRWNSEYRNHPERWNSIYRAQEEDDK